MTTCVHGKSLGAECPRCVESYGDARPTAELGSVGILSGKLRWKNGVLEQEWVGNGGAGPYSWHAVPTVDTE